MRHKGGTNPYGWQRIVTLLAEALTFIIIVYFLFSATGCLMFQGNFTWFLTLFAALYSVWLFNKRSRQLFEKQWMASAFFWSCGGIVYVLLRWVGLFSFSMN